jgi:cell division protein FtsB
MRWVTWALLALFALLQYGLWLAKGSLPQVWGLRSQLQQQLSRNDGLQSRNQRTQAELQDLQEGLEMVEEKARRELGMLKPDEVLVRVAPRP